MKFSILWHINSLNNWIASYEIDQATISRMLIESASNKQAIDFYKKQIEEAQRQGKDGFDSEKFLTKKKQENI
jgi:hypothetical protein